MMIRHRYSRFVPGKPLRYQIDMWFRPETFLAIYLALIGFYGLFEVSLVSTFGWSFLGIYQRPVTLGMYLFVAGTAIWVLLVRRPVRAKPVSLAAQMVFIFFLLEFLLLALMGVQYGRARGNVQVVNYQQGLEIFIMVAVAGYLATESTDRVARILRPFVYLLVFLSLLNAVSVIANNATRLIRLPFASFDMLFVLPFAAIYFLARYLMTSRRRLLALLMFIGATAGVFLRFEKPVLVPFVLACAVLYGLLLLAAGKLSLTSRWQLLKRILILIAGGVLVLTFVELIVPGNLLGELLLLFFRRFLKFNPTTAQVIGRLDGGRFYLWQQGWEMLKTSPLWGVGFGPGIRSDLGTVVFPHNLLVEFLVGTGLLGGTVLLAWLAASTVYILRSFNWNEQPIFKLGLLGFLIYALIVSMVGVLWGHLALLNLTALTLGMVLKIATLDREGRTNARPGPGEDNRIKRL
ncbi:MAG: O-antigen ligase domain-containing protein [Chloroflexi bacterium]|nr:MAG: O-antigen ligase domain-containing protein [Chloroflexota bacterium]